MANYNQVGNIVRIQAQVDSTGVLSMVKTFDKGINNAQKLAANRIQQAIKHEILDKFVRALCLRAGPGWPQPYTEHLVTVIRHTIDLPYYVSKDRTEIGVLPNFNDLGDSGDFKKAYHYQALTSVGDRTDLHKSGQKHHGYNPHPGRVALPYANQPLLVDDERRTEFWNQVVIDRDFSFELLLRRGKENWVLADHMALLGYEINTFNEVALARVLAWGNKAPQWLLLENGTQAGTRPEIIPVDFLRSIKTVGDCVASRIYEGAITTLIELAEQSGVLEGSTGLPYFPAGSGRGGQFAAYKELLEINVPDYSYCFGRI